MLNWGRSAITGCLNELGRGGMGIVYRAWDLSLDRLVAVKVLRPEQSHETDRLRLIREARITAQFRHDHAVMVHAVADPDDGPPYLVMEYVMGPTLAQSIDSPERPQPRQVAGLARSSRAGARRGPRGGADPSRRQAEQHPLREPHRTARRSRISAWHVPKRARAA